MHIMEFYMAKITTISLSKETHKKLGDYGSKSQTFDEIVSELLEFRRNYHE